MPDAKPGPGAYVEPVPSGSRPMESVGTSVAAFVTDHPAQTAAGVFLAIGIAVAAARFLRGALPS